MYRPRIVDLVSATSLFVHIFVVLRKSFPFHFKMHDITPHIGSNMDSTLKANARFVYLR